MLVKIVVIMIRGSLSAETSLPALCIRGTIKILNQFSDFLIIKKIQLKWWPAIKLSGGSGGKSEAAKIYLPNFPTQKGKEGQFPTEATLAASVCRREKFTPLPIPDRFVSLVTNLHDKNNVCIWWCLPLMQPLVPRTFLLFSKVLVTTLPVAKGSGKIKAVSFSTFSCAL